MKISTIAISKGLVFYAILLHLVEWWLPKSTVLLKKQWKRMQQALHLRSLIKKKQLKATYVEYLLPQTTIG